MNVNTEMNFHENWERPFTAKRYLHGPFAEYMYTMWADFKILCGEIVEQTCGYRSSAVKLLLGENLQELDFKKTKTIGRADGIPIHTLSYETSDLQIDMEALCNVGLRIPTVFVKVRVKNRTHRTIKDQLALLPRTGREDHLVGMEVDGYAHFDCNVHNFGFLPSHWEYDGKDYLTDGEYEIGLTHDGFQAFWQDDPRNRPWYQYRLLMLPFELSAKEEKTFTFFLRPKMDADRSFCYETERKKSEAFWQAQLNRLHRVPDSEAHRDVVNNLVLQCLQMFCYPRGKDYVLPRQGGLQRQVWPVEANEFLLALNELGDFGEYTKTAYDTFFQIFQKKEGPEKGGVFTGNMWASNTGGALWCCSHYLVHSGSVEAYERYRDDMYLGFQWIQEKRAISYRNNNVGKGIFPAMKSSDWPGEYQSWCITDCTTLEGMRWLAKAYEKFKDPRAAEVTAAYNDYMACMKKILDEEVAKNTMEGEILLTNKVGITLEDPPSGPYFDDGPANLLRVGVIDPNSETAHLAEAYFRNRGCMKNGLTGLMNDGLIFQGHNADPWAGHTWYVSSGDHWWFLTWLAQGEREKARETLEAQLYYGMTDAYQLLERYADNDPYWVPWMPNASANGRMLDMLSRFYGLKEL